MCGGRSVNQVMSGDARIARFRRGCVDLSHARGLQFGLITDAKMSPDPEAILERFARVRKAAVAGADGAPAPR
jgi:hypothetical protein